MPGDACDAGWPSASPQSSPRTPWTQPRLLPLNPTQTDNICYTILGYMAVMMLGVLLITMAITRTLVIRKVIMMTLVMESGNDANPLLLMKS